jgi:reductive dehalogenase
MKRSRVYPDPFPVWKLKRVERPTIRIISDKVQRKSEGGGGFPRAGRGEFGPFIQKEYPRFVMKHPLSGVLMDMGRKLAKMVDGEVAPKRAPGTDYPLANAQHIKETAYFLRADLVGICELPPYSVFTHDRYTNEPIKCHHKYAIGILVDQNWRTAAAFNGHDWISNSMSFMSYTISGFIACNLAEYIRRLGYPALANHAMNYSVAVPPILLWAGLGEMCRIGDMVLNPFLGPRFKAAVVTTDMPLAIDKPIDFGLQDFCSKCMKCARECPSQAISYDDKKMYNGYERWILDVEKCTRMRVGNQHGAGCGTCIKVCPWNKPSAAFHRLVGWTMMHVPFVRQFGVWGDDLMGYGKPKPRWQWWMDLEEVDGELCIPKSRDQGKGLDYWMAGPGKGNRS